MEKVEFEELANKKIKNITSLQSGVMKRLKETKTAVNDELRKEVERVVPDVTTLPEYTRLGAKDVDDFFDKVSKDTGTLCDIIGRYTATDRMYHADDGFDSDLEKAYEKKNSKKTALKKRANEIIQMYKQVLVENQEIINKMKENIKEKKEEKTRLESDLAAVTKQSVVREEPASIALREKFINETKAKIVTLENEIKTENDKLSELVKLQAEYKLKVEQAISKFENKFNDEAKVEVGSYEKENAPTASQDNGTGSSNLVASGNKINALVRSNDSDRVKAKKMLLDLQNMSADDREKLINQYGYEDLLEMSKNLGPFGRNQLRKVLDRSIDRGNLKIGGQTITGGQIQDAQLQEIVREVNEFNANIEHKSPKEILEFQDKIEKLNIIALYESATTKKLTRFFRNFTNKGSLINDLNQALKKFSNVRYERETAALNATNKLRETIHISKLNDNRPRVFLDKTKKNQINYDRSR